MANTGAIDTGARLSISGSVINITLDFYYNAYSRVDNTVYFNGVALYYYYGRMSGGASSFTYSTGWSAYGEVPHGASRAGSEASGTRNVNQWYGPTGGGDFAIAVGTWDTSVGYRAAGRFKNDGFTYGYGTVYFMALGAPYITGQSVTNIKPRTATINSTFYQGDYSSGISSIQVQYGLTTSYGSTASGGTVNLTGLKPGTVYHYRFIATNNGGKSVTTGDYTFKTQAVAGALPVLMGLLQ